MPPRYIPVRDLIRLAQGFYFVFWGLLVAALAGSQLTIVLAQQRLVESFLLGGVLATLAGTFRLRQARLDVPGSPEIGARWQRRIRATLWPATLMVYFAGLFLLWRRLPANLYLMSNALLFAATGIWFVIVLNRAVAAMAAVLDHPDLAAESKIYGAGNVAFLLLPLFGIGAFVATAVFVKGANAVDALEFLLMRTSWFPFIVVMLPFSLSLSLVWVAKDAALHRLAMLDRPNPE